MQEKENQDNSNKDEAARIAALMLLWKLQLEQGFKYPLKRLFNQIGKDAVGVWAATNAIPSLNSFSAELTTVLRGRYRIIAKKFGGEFIGRINNPELLTRLQASETLNHNIINYINKQSIQQSNYILDTTSKELQKISANEVLKNSLSETPASKNVVAKAINKAFKDATDNRIDTIATTETQIVSEQIKQMEAQEVANIGLALEKPPVVIKTWGAILDEKTRHSHAAADRQQRKVNQPYLVQNQLLMVPGDTSLGATLDNIINCRCSSVSHIFGDNLIDVTPEPALIE